ncbi:MAG: SdpI family protein [Chitinophagaceae bacterium]
MRPKLHITELLILIIIFLPFIYLAIVFKNLPQTVPTHFDLNGKPNAMSDKSSLWFILSITGVISVLLYLLMRFLPSIDPKKKAKYSAPVFNKIAVAVVLLLCIINCLIINSAQKGFLNFQNIFPAIIGAFFAFMGNIMHSIKPNYFAGIRTPWTLENEEVWRKTHQLGGKLWFIGGIVIAITGLLFPLNISTFFLIGIIIILVVVPVAYSYQQFKLIQKKS